MTEIPIDTELDTTIERRIIIGMVVSTEYLSGIKPWWDSDFIASEVAYRLSEWIWEYYNEYQEAPFKNIEDIYLEKRHALPDDVSEEIKNAILPSLSLEFDRLREHDKFNVDYLLDRSVEYFRQRHLEIHNEHERRLLLEGKQDEAEKLRTSYMPLVSENDEDYDGIYMGSEESIEMIGQAFSEKDEALIKFPGPFGDLIENQLCRDAFVAFLAPEKRGKSFILLEMTFRALMQGNNVVLFQVGDMSEKQQGRRMTEYITGRSRMYTKIYTPVRDCILNQIGSCILPKRQGTVDLGIVGEEDINKELLVRNIDTEYQPCRNCELHEYGKGSLFYEVKEDTPITKEQAQIATREWYKKYSKRLRLSTFSNGQMTVEKMNKLLDKWERLDGFVPDVVVIDYADLLVPPGGNEIRHNVDAAWRGLRGMSQKRHCLVLTATQADAKSNQQMSLNLSNFSEDKRKFSHVTAMYAMNQDPAGVEKRLGIMRYAELLVRDGDPYEHGEVYVMENRSVGKAFEGSFTRTKETDDDLFTT